MSSSLNQTPKEFQLRVCVANTRIRSPVENKFLYDYSLASIAHLGLHMIVIVGNYEGPSVENAEFIPISSPSFLRGSSFVTRIVDSLEAQFRMIQELGRKKIAMM